MREAFINNYSFPCPTRNDAFTLMTDTMLGFLDFLEDNRAALFSDTSSLRELILADDYSFQNYLDELMVNDRDLFEAVTEFEDKSPAINHLADPEIETACEYTAYIRNMPCMNMDCFVVAIIREMVILSIPTSDLWKDNKIAVSFYKNSNYRDLCSIDLINISCKNHGTTASSNAIQEIFNDLLPKRFARSRIYIYANDHNPAHFHVTGHGWSAKINIDTMELIIGNVQLSQITEEVEWAREKQNALRDIWYKHHPPRNNPDILNS